MNHTIPATVGVLVAIISALTGTITTSNIQQTAAAYNTNSTDPNPSNNNNNNNSTDIEKSTTDFKFKQKEKNNCTGFTNCCNIASQTVVDLNRAIIVPLTVAPPPEPVCPIAD
jgi:hypothetical protein